MLAINNEFRAFLESGTAVSVGTRDSNLVPHAIRGWGPRVSSDGRAVEVFMDRPSATDCVEDLKDNGRIAVCFVDIITFRAVQLKGRCVEIGDPQAEDWAWVERHRAAFSQALGSIGFSPQLIRNLWSTQVVKVRFVVEHFFNQTPGPEAGKAL